MQKKIILALFFVVSNTIHASAAKSATAAQTLTITLPQVVPDSVNIAAQLAQSVDACRTDITAIAGKISNEMLQKMDATGAAVQVLVKENAAQIHSHLDKTVQLFDVKTIIAHGSQALAFHAGCLLATASGAY